MTTTSTITQTSTPDDTPLTLAEVKQNLSAARENAAEFRSMLKPFTDALNDRIEAIREVFAARHAELINLCETADRQESEAEQLLREFAVSSYRQTGEKNLDGNVSVRITAKLSYETSDAVAWAEKNAPVMIVRNIDKKAFESLPGTADLEFVRKIDSVTAVLKGI